MSSARERWIVDEPELLRELLARRAQAAALADGRVFVSGRRALTAELSLRVGDVVEIYEPRSGPSRIAVLAAHQGLVVVEKPAGIATEAEHRGSEGTVVALAARELGVAIERVHALSRLDVGVSGVVLLGLDASSRRRVSELRAQGAVRRRYIALAAGALATERGTFRDPIRRSKGERRREVAADGEPSISHYRVVAASRAGCVLAFEPETGRTHQLRVHAAAHGVPLLGDRTYGGPARITLANGAVRPLPRIFLHASWVELPGLLRVESACPLEFIELAGCLGCEAGAIERAVHETVR